MQWLRSQAGRFGGHGELCGKPIMVAASASVRCADVWPSLRRCSLPPVLAPSSLWILAARSFPVLGFSSNLLSPAVMFSATLSGEKAAQGWAADKGQGRPS